MSSNELSYNKNNVKFTQFQKLVESIFSKPPISKNEIFHISLEYKLVSRVNKKSSGFNCHSLKCPTHNHRMAHK